MKKLQFFLAILIAVFGIFSSANAGFPKFPLMEYFTNAGCGPCADYQNAGYAD
jgi:hypothetical protein